MSKTVILCNPYGSDVTDWINGTPLVPQILKGTVVSAGDTLITLDYNWNVSSLVNIEAGAVTLNTVLNETSGQILVFSYSEGCQVADLWLNEYGQSSPITPTSRLSFLSIGNADRKFGGFAYQKPVFAKVGYTGGLPATVPYAYTDFARQYDFVADFPTDPNINNALVELESIMQGTTSITSGAASAAMSKMAGTAQWDAAENAAIGLALIHDFYENVAPSDSTNVWYTDPTNGVQYGLALTYPVPLLGVGTLFCSADKTLRAQIEKCYQRPFASIPQPNYAALMGMRRHQGLA